MLSSREIAAIVGEDKVVSLVMAKVKLLVATTP
jgi:hypothetical protein